MKLNDKTLIVVIVVLVVAILVRHNTGGSFSEIAGIVAGAG